MSVIKGSEVLHKARVVNLVQDGKKFYAEVWRDNEGDTKLVEYANPDYYQPDNSAFIDAPHEIICSYQVWKEKKQEESKNEMYATLKGELITDVLKYHFGDIVKLTDDFGEFVEGTEVKVFWNNNDRIGFETRGGLHGWCDEDCVERIDNREENRFAKMKEFLKGE